MSDYDYDPSEYWDITDDPGFEEAAQDWADKNADELIAAYAENDLTHETEAAHKAILPEVQRSLDRAKEREHTGDLDEAVFHCSRALEGYVRAVYLNPLFAAMTRAFEDRMKVSKLLAHDIMPSQLRNARKLLLFAILGVTKDAKEATNVVNAIKSAMSSGAWNTRNRVDHTLHIPDAAEAAAFRALVDKALDAVAKPLRDRITAAEERQRKLAEEGSRRANPFEI